MLNSLNDVLLVFTLFLFESQGCGRGSQQQHALKHYETPRSTIHALSLCINNLQVWCYKCDEAIYPDDSRKLLECVDWVRKEMGTPKLLGKFIYFYQTKLQGINARAAILY